MEYIIFPTEIGIANSYVLIILSCFTSMLTASVGIGGGTLLLAAMADIVPVTAVIPVHGMVQLGSNVGRTGVLFSRVHKPLVAWFLAGSLFGALLGGHIVIDLPVQTLRVILGIFILFSVWSPNIPGLSTGSASLFAGGFISTILTMFVGATGPFVLALLRVFSLKPESLVATSACCLSIQHLLKVIVFRIFGLCIRAIYFSNYFNGY